MRWLALYSLVVGYQEEMERIGLVAGEVDCIGIVRCLHNRTLQDRMCRRRILLHILRLSYILLVLCGCLVRVFMVA